MFMEEEFFTLFLQSLPLPAILDQLRHLRGEELLPGEASAGLEIAYLSEYQSVRSSLKEQSDPIRLDQLTHFA
jgi:hypothetical protein